MHGLIFNELKKFANTRFGEGTWDALVQAAALKRRPYLATEAYPDEDMLALVGAASAATHRRPDVLLEDFGEFIAPDLFSMYDLLVDRRWGLLDFLLETEKVIHRAVRLQNPGAEPPVLRAERLGPNEVAIVYGSARSMCAVAKGIIRGAATHYGTPARIRESECMKLGAPACRIVVTTTSART